MLPGGRAARRRRETVDGRRQPDKVKRFRTAVTFPNCRLPSTVSRPERSPLDEEAAELLTARREGVVRGARQPVAIMEHAEPGSQVAGARHRADLVGAVG